jgi:predicted dehydrogenase
MNKTNISLGFLGAGGIARSHAFALNSIRYYYSDPPPLEFSAVASASEKSRDSFAARFGFRKSLSPSEFFAESEIDTVFILGPNSVHCDHLEQASKMESVKRIYIEKPLCSSVDEEKRIADIATGRGDLNIQAGFQYLFMSAIREALIMWRSGIFGKPVHFDLRYFHGDYLRKAYRDKRANRLTPAPDGGAMADLGSHAISLAVAFLGHDLEVTGASASGNFPDVDHRSDLFSVVMLRNTGSGAAGTISASRVASGTGDTLSMELYAERGSIRFTTAAPGFFEYYLEDTGKWTRIPSGSRYAGITSFPSEHVPPGWLRSMIHAHYVFLTGNDKDAFIPGIWHGLEVQRIIREAARYFYP